MPQCSCKNCKLFIGLLLQLNGSWRTLFHDRFQVTKPIQLELKVFDSSKLKLVLLTPSTLKFEIFRILKTFGHSAIPVTLSSALGF